MMDQLGRARGKKRDSDPSQATDRPSSLLDSKLRCLMEAILELNAEIRSRGSLSQAFLDGIKAEAERVRDLVSRLGEPWSKGYLPEFEGLRAKLVAELHNLTNRERSERLRAWEDIVALKKARRAYLIEYEALKRTAELLEERDGA